MVKQLVAIARNGFEDIEKQLEDARIDAIKFYYNGNMAAGQRLRVALRNLEKSCKSARKACMKFSKEYKKVAKPIEKVVEVEEVDKNQLKLV
jgi:hypothetical protein